MKILLVLILSLLLSSCWHPSLEDAEKLGFSSVKEMNRIINLGYKTKQEYDYRYKKYGFSSLKKMKAAMNLGYKTKSDFDNRYKKFGFKSLDEMKSLRIQGYTTKKKYLSVKKNTPEWFIERCMSPNNSLYEVNCFGQKIIWKGVVVSLNPSSVSNMIRIDVRDDNGEAPSRSFDIDSKSLTKYADEFKTGQLIEFHGLIDKENWTTPDVEYITFVQPETEKEMSVRLLIEKRIVDTRILKAQQKLKKHRAQKLKAVKENEYNANWLNEKYNIDGGVQCQKAIPKLAKYAYKWTDGFLEQKFAYYKQIIEEAGVLTLVGDKVQFQNGFGAWAPTKYWCSYDVRTDSVIDYGLY